MEEGGGGEGGGAGAMELEEKDGQEEYEQFMTDAADKRAADTLSIQEKEAAKALLEDTIVKSTDKKAAEEDELMATKQYIAELHADCDWLLENFETRKELHADCDWLLENFE